MGLARQMSCKTHQLNAALVDEPTSAGNATFDRISTGHRLGRRRNGARQEMAGAPDMKERVKSRPGDAREGITRDGSGDW
jgi:hypothetical protein